MGGGKGGKGAANAAPLEARVYVGNLAWDVSWQDLKDHMRKAGEVVFADVMTEPMSGRSKGCGLVAYSSEEEAKKACEELGDTDLKGRQIFVREDREAEDGKDTQACRVYVGNLAWGATWRDLKDTFRDCGEIKRADVMVEGNVEGARSKGYGIVEFSIPEEAALAVKQLQDVEILGRKIFVREDRESFKTVPIALAYGKGDYYYRGGKGKSYGGKGKVTGKGKGKGKGYDDAGHGGKGEGDPMCKVFVANLSFESTWQDLKDHCRTVGDVVHAEIMTDGPGGRSKGWGVVEFATHGAARRAVERLHDSVLGDRAILVREYRQ